MTHSCNEEPNMQICIHMIIAQTPGNQLLLMHTQVNSSRKIEFLAQALSDYRTTYVGILASQTCVVT